MHLHLAGLSGQYYACIGVPQLKVEMKESFPMRGDRNGVEPGLGVKFTGKGAGVQL